MAAETTRKTAPRAQFDFLMHSLGKRVVVETTAVQPALQTERYSGTLEEVYDDSLLIRPDSGRLVLIYKHAIVHVSEG
jgi:hypothetical protein